MGRTQRQRAAGKVKSETLLIIVFLVGWFALQMFVLPKLGIMT